MDEETHDDTTAVSRNELSSKVDVSCSDTTVSVLEENHGTMDSDADVLEESREKTDSSVLSNVPTVHQLFQTESSGDEMVVAEKTASRSDSDQDDTSQRGYFDDVCLCVNQQVAVILMVAHALTDWLSC